MEPLQFHNESEGFLERETFTEELERQPSTIRFSSEGTRLELLILNSLTGCSLQASVVEVQRVGSKTVEFIGILTELINGRSNIIECHGECIQSGAFEAPTSGF